MMITTHTKTNELVVNWHITEACNYSCSYCFGKWEKGSRELIHDLTKSRALVHALSDYFQPTNSSRQLGYRATSDCIRLNIAGGEPFLYPKQFKAIADEATSLKMKLSCITNGSRLDENQVIEFAPLMDVLGVSVDSVCENINATIGRQENKGGLEFKQLINSTKLARNLNPQLKLKINTVVNAANWTANLGGFIEAISPDKWKIFKMLPTLNDQLTIKDSEYHSFIKRHRHLKHLMTIEDNDAMTHSYLMIDPLGRFYQNKTFEKGYDYSDPILEVGVETALAQIQFNADRFIGRY